MILVKRVNQQRTTAELWRFRKRTVGKISNKQGSRKWPKTKKKKSVYRPFLKTTADRLSTKSKFPCCLFCGPISWKKRKKWSPKVTERSDLREGGGGGQTAVRQSWKNLEPSANAHLVSLAHALLQHDPEICTPGGDDGNYIMFARATSGDKRNNNRFSPCSLSAINPVLNVKARSARGCFTGTDGVRLYSAT